MGVTREVARLCRDGIDFAWRLSLADVGTSGAFSEFDGYDRTITLLDGEGFSLNFEDGRQKIMDTPYVPYDFDGGAPLCCNLLGGPSRDLNLIIHREEAQATCTVDNLDAPLTLGPLTLGTRAQATQLIFCLQGRTHLKSSQGEHHVLDRWDSMELDAGTTISLTADPDSPPKIFHATIGSR
ncbi:MAG: HutD family protein [Rhodospirillales bacterium]|nr:HutD family protein [Rhodospirillales bacterium]